MLLFGLLDRPRPCGMNDVVLAANPPPADGLECRRWCHRQGELREVFLRLYRRGLIREAVKSGQSNADGYELTTAGREAAIEAYRLWACP